MSPGFTYSGHIRAGWSRPLSRALYHALAGSDGDGDGFSKRLKETQLKSLSLGFPDAEREDPVYHTSGWYAACRSLECLCGYDNGHDVFMIPEPAVHSSRKETWRTKEEEEFKVGPVLPSSWRGICVLASAAATSIWTSIWTSMYVSCSGTEYNTSLSWNNESMSLGSMRGAHALELSYQIYFEAYKAHAARSFKRLHD